MLLLPETDPDFETGFWEMFTRVRKHFRPRPASRPDRRPPRPPAPDALRTTQEAAARLGCTTRTLARHVASGELPYLTIGRGTKRARRRFTDADLNEFIAAPHQEGQPVSVYKPVHSPYFLYDFWLKRHRLHGTTGCTTRREAEKVEATEREKAKAYLAQIHAAKTSLRLDDIAGRFWEEKGQHVVGRENTEHRLGLIIEFLGKDILLTDISDDHVARLKAWRRGHHKTYEVSKLIAPATVNHTIATLRELFTYAKLVLRVRFEHEPTWRKHWLKVPTERVRELHDDEADRLDAHMRDDWRPFFAFVRASGLRLNECLLRWAEVNGRRARSSSSASVASA